MNPTSDGPEAVPPRPVRPPWLGPMVLAVGLVVLAALCIGLSVWGP